MTQWGTCPVCRKRCIVRSNMIDRHWSQDYDTRREAATKGKWPPNCGGVGKRPVEGTVTNAPATDVGRTD